MTGSEPPLHTWIEVDRFLWKRFDSAGVELLQTAGPDLHLVGPDSVVFQGGGLCAFAAVYLGCEVDRFLWKRFDSAGVELPRAARRRVTFVVLPLQSAAMNVAVAGAVAVGSHARKGLVCGVLAYIWWGLIPLYFKSVASVPSPLVLDHRIIWSAGLLAIIVTWQRRWSDALGLIRQPRKIGLLLCASVLIAANWGVFIYAVASSRTMQASLGYFINPLLSIVLGMVFLRERLRRVQWLAVAIASIGVAYLTWRTGEFPWIAMLCAGTFAFYGLVRKLAAVPSIDGLCIETLVLLLPAAAIVKPLTDQAPAISPSIYFLLTLSGIITVLPLFWFNVAVQHLRLTTIGFLQYIGPTGQFLVALLVFREPLDHNKLIAFAFCWVAVAVYSLDAWRRTRAAARPAIEAPVPLEA